MPFQSTSQRRACYAKGDPKWDCATWQKETPKGALPERKAKPKGRDQARHRVKVLEKAQLLRKKVRA